MKAGSSGEFEEGLGGVEAGETVTIKDSIEDGGGKLVEKLGKVFWLSHLESPFDYTRVKGGAHLVGLDMRMNICQ